MTAIGVEPAVDAYLARFERELSKRFVTDAGIVEEVRGHLVDAIDGGQQHGLSIGAAADEAIGRFGRPEIVAAAFAADRFRTLHRWLLAAAIAAGVAIAFVDARPTWDDTGVTAGMLTIVAGMLGLAGPRRAWAWALAVGIWIPASAVVRAPSLGSIAMFLVLLFPFAGAYLGAGVRRLAKYDVVRRGHPFPV